MLTKRECDYASRCTDDTEELEAFPPEDNASPLLQATSFALLRKMQSHVLFPWLSNPLFCDGMLRIGLWIPAPEHYAAMPLRTKAYPYSAGEGVSQDPLPNLWEP